jgi:hypothetical protein
MVERPFLSAATDCRACVMGPSGLSITQMFWLQMRTSQSQCRLFWTEFEALSNWNNLWNNSHGEHGKCQPQKLARSHTAPSLTIPRLATGERHLTGSRPRIWGVTRNLVGSQASPGHGILVKATLGNRPGSGPRHLRCTAAARTNTAQHPRLPDDNRRSRILMQCSCAFSRGLTIMITTGCPFIIILHSGPP